MNRVYRILCVWIVLAMALSSLGPVVSAQAAEGASEGASSYAPPRPDLSATLQKAQLKAGKSMSALEAEKASNAYVASKIGSAPREDRFAKAKGVGSELAASSSVTGAVVALVQFSDRAHNLIPDPHIINPENNTDYWVADFSRTHYETMLSATNNEWSLRNYFLEASYGSYDLVSSIHDWTTLPTTGTLARYGNDDPAGGVDNYKYPANAGDANDSYDVEQLVKDAADTLRFWPLTAPWEACSAGTGISRTIDYFVVVHAGRGQEATGTNNDIWSVRGKLPAPYWVTTTIGGNWFYVEDYVVVAEDAPVGVFVHEYAHLLGLPDTWNPRAPVNADVDWPQQDPGGVGEPAPAFYDVMGQGCWLGSPLGTKPASMTAYERIQLGWISDSQIAKWDVSSAPRQIHLSQLETQAADNHVAKIDLPDLAYLSPHSGSWMWGSPVTGTTGLYTSTLTGRFALTCTNSLQFSFWQWRDLHAGHDIGYVDICTDTVNWVPVYSTTGFSGIWQQASVNLVPYLNGVGGSPTIQLRFRLVRDGSFAGVGWYLDDFQLACGTVVVFLDNAEGGTGVWGADNFFLTGALTSEHYYLLEWRNDQAGFDRGLGEVYNWTDLSKGKARYFDYNPGLLIWYVNPAFPVGDNNAASHPGEGFLLDVDSHPNPFPRMSNGQQWRTRVQMQDATFRQAGKTTYVNPLIDPLGALFNLGGLPSQSVFLDLWHSYPYYTSTIPYNSVKTPQYGIRVEVTEENQNQTGAWLQFSTDAANMGQSSKTVDKAIAEPGQELLYTIVLRNFGVADAYTIVVSDTAPAHTTYIMGSVIVTGSASYAVTETNGIRFQGLVPLNSPVTITFRVLIDPVVNNGTIIHNVGKIYEGPVWERDVTADTTVRSAPCLVYSAKEAMQQIVLPGDVITYMITVSNTGNMNAPRVIITDCLPALTTFVQGSLTYTIGSAVYNPLSKCIVWTGPVSVGQPVYIWFVAKVVAGHEDCCIITNDAWVNDGFHPPFRISENVIIERGPNLIDSYKTVDKTLAQPGDQLQYTVVLSNVGNEVADGTLIDYVPGYTDYVSGSLAITYIGGATGSGDDSGGVVTWMGSIPSGAGVRIGFRVTVTDTTPDATVITNTAMIFDDYPHNFERVVTTTISTVPNLSSSFKQVSRRTAEYGEVLTYTIALVNSGKGAANVLLLDPIPGGTDYYGGPNIGAYYAVTDTVQWDGTINAGARVTVTFQVSVTIETTGVITNIATVYWDKGQPIQLITTTNVAAIMVVSPTSTIYCGDLVTVPIRVENVLDLRGFQATVEWDPSILYLEALVNQGTWFTGAAWELMEYNNITGTSTVVAVLYSSVPAKNGSGNLYFMRFRGVGQGTSPVTITYSLMGDTPYQWVNSIHHNVIGGSVTVAGRSIVGYAFLQGPIPPYWQSAELYDEGSGQHLGTADPDGFYEICPPIGNGRTFMLRVQKDGYLWSHRLITVNFTNTLVLPDVLLLGGDTSRGTPVVTASPLTCTTPITVSVPGAPDGVINLSDLSFVGGLFGKNSGMPDWGWPKDICHPEWWAYRADITQDFEINVLDLVVLGANYGKVAPSPWL